ncbi:MAG: hypothetical protein EKK64_06565 [Neisseriaceae bacterium]|nr:MAG: hypothetical protein EKK64_06565 [Neisseriaceae bacterium]
MHYCLRTYNIHRQKGCYEIWINSNNRNHRKKGPAVVYSNGDKEYWIQGRRHRDSDLPAVNSHRGFEYWNNGVKYKIIEQPNGTKEYWSYLISTNSSPNSLKLHMENKPAIIYPNGDVEYWQWGKRHRNNGPAVIYGNKQYWFYYGEFIKCTS